MYPLAKRCFDLVAALAGLCLLIPLLLLFALLVFFAEGSPVIYREYRLGRGQRPFSLLKFRTLNNGSSTTPRLAIEGDPRVTRTGQWLRRWRLDEFPSLVNVLLGDMSLVGPRPMTDDHAAYLTDDERRVIYSVRPGLTDTTAVEFLAEDAVLAEATDPENLYFNQLFHPKMQTTVDGIEKASFIGDIGILLMTAKQLWSRQARQHSERVVRSLLDLQ